MRAALAYLTCVNLVAMPFAWAETTSSGAAGSITIGTMDPANPTHPISDKFHYGDQTRLDIHAYNANGVEVPCNNPAFEVLNDFGSTQIAGVDNNRIMTMGNGLGEPRLRVRCEGLAGVVGELHVYNMKKMVPHKFGKPPAEAPSLMQPVPNTLMAPVTQSTATQAETASPAGEAAAAAGNSGSAVMGALLGVGIAVGAAALVVAATKSSPCTPPELACGGQYDKGCCPAGLMYICKAPANKAGCYDTVFITGCTEKYFCGSDY